jgi:Glycosyl transferase family 2
MSDSNPDISFIVTAWGKRRPEALPVLLACLRAQTFKNWEALVLDSAYPLHHTSIFAEDDRFHCFHHPLGKIHERHEMYHVTEWGAERALGRYLCFASDDSYYCPWFIERMVSYTDREQLDLVLCDLVLGSPQVHGVIDSKPFIGAVDKTNFIVRRDKMIPFPGKDDPAKWAQADGAFVEKLVTDGARWGKVNQVLAVHN